jgi:CRISPR-associated protein Cas2
MAIERFDNAFPLGYHAFMYVSVVCDLGSEDSRAAVFSLLPQYGFEKVQRACFESGTVAEKQLAALKRDIDKVTDYYDTIRLYQYPVDGVLAVSILKQNQWRRIMIRATAEHSKVPKEEKPGVDNA